MKQRIRCLVASLSIALAGCATNFPPSSEPYLSGYVPPGGMAAMPHIVADDRPPDLPGFENLSARAARRYLRSAEAAAPIVAGCLVYFPFCPVVLAGVGVTAGWIAPRETSAEGLRLVAIFTQRATGASLASRTTRLAKLAGIPAANAPAAARLVVRMESARLSYEGSGFSITLHAQAQAFPAAGIEWPPTHFHYALPARSIAEWTADDDRLVRLGIDEALDAFARRISSLYGLEVSPPWSGRRRH